MITKAEQISSDCNYSVMSPGMWDNDTGPKDWYAILDEREDGGIVAYAMTEAMAVEIANHLHSLEEQL